MLIKILTIKGKEATTSFTLEDTGIYLHFFIYVFLKDSVLEKSYE